MMDEKRHAALMEKVGEGILMVAEQEEKRLDEQLKSLENLGEIDLLNYKLFNALGLFFRLDEDSFEALRQKRKLMLQKKMRQEQDWRQLGHGRYSEVTDTKDFFNTCKKSARVVCHFYRRTTPRCEIVDAHLERLAHEHVEARFIKIEAEKNPFLVERLGIILMPTIVLIKDGKTDHAIHGFDEFGGTDDFTTSDVGYVLANHGMINMEVDRSEEIQATSARAGFNHIRLNRIKAGEYDDLDDDDI